MRSYVEYTIILFNFALAFSLVVWYVLAKFQACKQRMGCSMGEGIRNVGADAFVSATAAQASEDIKRKQEKELKPARKPGARLEGLPKAAEQNILIKDAPEGPDAVESLEPTEAAENILTDIDKQLDNVQKGLKDFIGKKIRLAAHNPSRSKELLQSAYRDTKKAYDKIKKVRDQLS